MTSRAVDSAIERLAKTKENKDLICVLQYLKDTQKELQQLNETKVNYEQTFALQEGRISRLEHELDHTKEKLCYLEKKQMEHNIVIRNVPEPRDRHENISQVVSDFLDKQISVKPEDVQIDICHRFGQKTQFTTS